MTNLFFSPRPELEEDISGSWSTSMDMMDCGLDTRKVRRCGVEGITSINGQKKIEHERQSPFLLSG